MTPLQLSAASGVPFYRQIVDQIADQVRAGRLPPGTLLPSVRELATDVGVSLITVRRAYADLEADGLIERRQGLGTFVADDVGKAARARARRDADDALREAVRRARQLGLDDGEIRAAVDSHLSSPDPDGDADDAAR